MFALAADAATWLVRAFDNYPFGFYEWSDAYLPVVFLFGLALLLPSLSLAVQTRRAANLAKFPLTTPGTVPPELRQEAGQVDPRSGGTREGSIAAKEFPPPRLAFVPTPSDRMLFQRIGRVSILLAVVVYVGVKWWTDTRTFVPFNAMMSFVHGHNRTREFRINFRAVYLINLDIPDYGKPNCQLRDDLTRRIHWLALRSGRTVAEGFADDWASNRGEPLGSFEAPAGLYTLDLDFPVDCVYASNFPPTLRVEIDRQPTGIYTVTEFVICFLVALGVILLFWPRVREMQGMSLGVEPATIRTGMVQSAQKARKPAARAKLLLHYPAAACALASVWAFVLPVFVMMITPRPPRGLMVHVPQPGTYARADEPWNEPLVVRVDAGGNLYLNRQPIPPSALEGRLRETLQLRADCRVYVDGDPNAAVGNVISVVDTLQGMSLRKVLLVTPSMKKEKPTSFVTPPCEIGIIQETELPFPPQRDRYGAYRPLVSFVVSEHGDASNTKILESSGDAEIDKWAVNSVLKWKYTSKPGCGSRVLEKQLSAYYYQYRY